MKLWSLLASIVIVGTSFAASAESSQSGRDLSHGLALLADSKHVTAADLFSALGTVIRAQGRVDKCHPEFGLDGVPPMTVTASIVSASRSPDCKRGGFISLLSVGFEERPGVSLDDQATDLRVRLGTPCSDTRPDRGRQQQVVWRRGANVIGLAEDSAAPNSLAITFIDTGMHSAGSSATEDENLLHAFEHTLPAACLDPVRP